jgi:hypothetical protein
VANVLLVGGYAVAVAVLLRTGVVLRERRWRWFVALEIATATVIVGYVLAGKAIGVALNILNLLVIAGVWVWTGRRSS